MKILEYEAKKVLEESGIKIPLSILIRSPDELATHLPSLPDNAGPESPGGCRGTGKGRGVS